MSLTPPSAAAGMPPPCCRLSGPPPGRHRPRPGGCLGCPPAPRRLRRAGPRREGPLRPPWPRSSTRKRRASPPSPSCSTSASARSSSTRPAGASPTGSTHPSTCGWIRHDAETRGRPRQQLARGRAGAPRRRQRRGPLQPAHRPGDRRQPAGPLDRRAGRAGPGSDPGGCPTARRPPGKAGLPGAPDRRQPRARAARAGPRRRRGRPVPGGRCAVLSYHSGEDRIVKDRFARGSRRLVHLPAGASRACAAPSRRSACSTGVPGCRLPTRSPGTRVPRAPGCGPSSASRRLFRHDLHHGDRLRTRVCRAGTTARHRQENF